MYMFIDLLLVLEVYTQTLLFMTSPPHTPYDNVVHNLSMLSISLQRYKIINLHATKTIALFSFNI